MIEFLLKDAAAAVARDRGLAPGRWAVVVRFGHAPLNIKLNEDPAAPSLVVSVQSIGFEPATTTTHPDLVVEVPERKLSS